MGETATDAEGGGDMTVMKQGLNTTVEFMPYTISSIDPSGHCYVIACDGKPVTVSSVKGQEDELVKVMLPNGESVIVKATSLIIAAQKCVCGEW